MQTPPPTLEELKRELELLSQKALNLGRAYFEVFTDFGRSKRDIVKKIRPIYKQMGAIQQAIREHETYQNDSFMGYVPANQSA